MPSIAVIYHSGFGHTRAQAAAVRAGATSVPGAQVALVPVEDLEDAGAPAWEQVDRADGIVLGAPTYMAGPSAAFKAFMDATSSRWAEQCWKDKLAAGFTNSAGINGDKLATLQHLSLFAMQHGMVWIGLGLLPGNTTSTSSPEELNRLAGFLGAMAQSPTDLGADVAPSQADRLTAEHLGARVARIAAGWRPGLLTTDGQIEPVSA